MEIQDILERAIKAYGDAIKSVYSGNKYESLIYFSVARSWFSRAEDPEGIRDSDNMIRDLIKDSRYGGELKCWLELGDKLTDKFISRNSIGKLDPVLEEISKN